MVPLFEHHGADNLPEIEAEGIRARLILGNVFGQTAPTTFYSETFYRDVVLEPGVRFPLPDNHEDRGLYVTQGTVEVAGQEFPAGRRMVFRPGDRIAVAAGPQGARLMALASGARESAGHARSCTKALGP
jgi:redox-sensitive bicupin YhaK (pirin superfamily)